MTNVERYINYLGRVQRKERVSLYELHQRLISRDVAREYGLSEEELINIDTTLSQRGRNPA